MTSSSSDNNNNKRGDPAQIPKEDVSGEVEKVISEHGGIEGQRKESFDKKVFGDIAHLTCNHVVTLKSFCSNTRNSAHLP
jgi:hypothetical protein